MSVSSNTNAPASIADATTYALRQEGKEILQNPQRLLSYLMDMTDESPELAVLELNLDDELLEPLANVVCGSGLPTMGGIKFAASRMEALLVDGRVVAAQPAHQAIEELCRGVINYLANRSGATQGSTGSAPATTPTPSSQMPAHPHTITVTPPTENKTSEPKPVTPTPVSTTPSSGQPNGASQGSQGSSSQVDNTAHKDPNPSHGASSSGTNPTTGVNKTASPAQPPKPKDYKRLLAIAAIAAAIFLVAALNRVTVTFKSDSAGTTGSTSAITAWRGSEVTLPPSDFSRFGYSFAGWDLNGTTYQPGDTIKASGPTTLSAIWAAKVTFDGNGADSGSVEDIAALPGESITLPDLVYERSGYYPIGWDMSGMTYDAGDEVTVNGPATYKVSWGPRVTFDGNDADSGSIKDILAEPGEIITLPKIDFKRSGYRANGWKVDGELYAAGDEITIDWPTTCRVDWGALVSFEGNGADSGSTSGIYADSDDKITAPKCGFEYADHIFEGWATSSTGSVRYEPGDTISASSPETYYAVWKLDPNIVDKLSVEQISQNSDDGELVLFFFITNNSSTTLDITDKVVFKTASGSEIETTEYTAYTIAPGDRTLIYSACSGAEVGEGATVYYIKAEESASSRGSIQSGIEVEEVSVTSENTTARLYNRTDKKIHLYSASCYCTGSYGSWSISGERIDEVLDPGESVEATFDYAYSSFSRQYFFNGYAEL